MDTQLHEQVRRIQQAPKTPRPERRGDKRRKQRSQGYTYITMVGWMDRREKKRRNDDPLDF
ncbi:MAG: hypothetical protein WBG37_01750 [Desulfobacterales bacterium]